MFWAVTMKQEKLWIRWLHACLLHQGKGHTWYGQCLFLKVYHTVLYIFTIKQMYSAIQGTTHPVESKAIFITWLVVLRRLSTKDRLLKWNIQIDQLCCFCGTGLKSIEHLFFQCSFTSKIWKSVLSLLKIRIDVLTFDAEVVNDRPYQKLDRVNTWVLL